MDIKIYSYSHRDEWDRVVTRAKNGTFLHLRNYMNYHAHRFNEQSIIVQKNGKAVAVFPCNRIEDRIISHSGLTYGGLIYGPDLRAGEVLEIFNLLAQYFSSLGITSLIYKAVPHIFHTYPAEEDLYALFRLKARLVRRDISSVIQIENRIKLSDSRKCTIRKAAKHSVQVLEGDFFEPYHELLVTVLEKFKSKPVHSLEELRLLKSRFRENIKLFGAFKDEKLLAGAIVYDFGRVAHTQYLASSDEGREVGALDFVLAYLVEHAFSDYRYLSFGISTEQDGMYLNEGLNFQKEGFGARGVVHDFYELSLV